MRTRVKFCGLVDPADLEIAVDLGVDAVGFVLWPRSSRAVTPAQALALRRRLPSWVLAVGLVVNARPLELAADVREIGLDVVQFHGDESPEDCRLASIPWWRAVRMRSADDLAQAVARYPDAEALVLDAFSDGYGGSGHSFDWNWVSPQSPQIPQSPRGPQSAARMDELPQAQVPAAPVRILSGGLHPGNVREAIGQVRPSWVDVSSGIQVEGEPRRKSRLRMEDFLSEVRAADCAVP